VGEAEGIPLFFTLIPVLALLSNYDRENCLINVGTEGEVAISKDKNGNTRLKMSVQHLANLENLTPRAAAYVVWLQERGGNSENQGQLKMDKNLKATFETVTPLKSFDVFVTAEQDFRAKTPSGPEVLKVTIQP
jgi:hypothetical protein